MFIVGSTDEFAMLKNLSTTIPPEVANEVLLEKLLSLLTREAPQSEGFA